MSSNKLILKVSLAIVPPSIPPGSQARQDDLIPRMLEFSSLDDRIAVGRSSSGRSPVPSLFNALFTSRSISRQHAELSIDPRTSLLMVEDLRSTHGTFLNNIKLASGITHYVHSGDILRFGSDVQHEERGHFAPRSFKVNYGSAPPETKHTVPIQARRPGTFQVPDTTTDEEQEEEDSDVEILHSTDTSMYNSPPKTQGLHPVELVSDSEDDVQVLSVTRRKPVGIALKDLFTEDDDECSSPLRFSAVPATSTSQTTVEHPARGTMKTQPSQDRMKIRNIITFSDESAEPVSTDITRYTAEGVEMVDLEHDIAESEVDHESEIDHELRSEAEDEDELPSERDYLEDEISATASELTANSHTSFVVEPAGDDESLSVSRPTEEVLKQLTRSDAEEVQEPIAKDRTAESQVADVVLPSVDPKLDDALAAARTCTIDAILRNARESNDSEQIRKRIEPLTRTLPDVKAYLAGVEEAENALVAQLSGVRKRQRDDDPMISTTRLQPPAQAGDDTAVLESASATGEHTNDELNATSSEPVHKRARHATPETSIPKSLPKHDKKAAAPATWQATIKPFMLGALVGGMGVFGGLLSMADMQ